MEINIPKNSETGGHPKNSWETVNHPSFMTQKEQIHLFGEYFSALSKKTKEIDEKIISFNLFKQETENKVTETLKTIKDTHALVFFGFFALVFVILGIAYGYWQFVFTSSKNEDYRYGLSDKINTQEKEIQSLKNCLAISKWLNPKCLGN